MLTKITRPCEVLAGAGWNAEVYQVAIVGMIGAVEKLAGGLLFCQCLGLYTLLAVVDKGLGAVVEKWGYTGVGAGAPFCVHLHISVKMVNINYGNRLEGLIASWYIALSLHGWQGG